ncbi:hypothetical protein DIC66_11415 [Rhodoferax lacus]|uniref:Uncharacterized protein n=1 Tax=Rhodoferax lacus TaxID=2184758 RepID=A0A3E1RB99_9BURK|nr:hypothetical protein [Rhodoferax lacus]RFO96628.1 hypothetical protein DIC66_11415 [Rhodoferax lacus]
MSHNAVKRIYPPVKEQPVVPPEQPVAAPEVPAELRERRRFNRPIPAAQVIECDEDEAWELWSQWSSL